MIRSAIVEIFLTGSSAKLLSKEIATSLRGRSLATEIWPYSLNEFLVAKKMNIDSPSFGKKTQDQLRSVFLGYLQDGGFPEVVNYTPEIRQRTLQDYIDIVIYRDIIERYLIKNAALIKYMIMTMIHNVGKPFTINKFYNDAKSQGYQVSKDALYDYADYLINYYLTDERYEVDFLIQDRSGNKQLLQVRWDMNDKNTLEREERALEAAKKELNIPGKIITLASYLREGIVL